MFVFINKIEKKRREKKKKEKRKKKGELFIFTLQQNLPFALFTSVSFFILLLAVNTISVRLNF